jgi:starch phosphorylase
LANGVSQLHGNVSRALWSKYENICPIISITNAQNWKYWADKQLYKFLEAGDDYGIDDRKKYLKERAFELVADQTGKIFNPDVFTIVWARRFAGYKRAGLLTTDEERFDKLMKDTKYPCRSFGPESLIPLIIRLSVNSINWCI